MNNWTSKPCFTLVNWVLVAGCLVPSGSQPLYSDYSFISSIAGTHHGWPHVHNTVQVCLS